MLGIDFHLTSSGMPFGSISGSVMAKCANSAAQVIKFLEK
jgi:hypothetical protein